MKPHPKIRKTVKWGGAAVSVLLLVVWVGSGWYDVSYFGESGVVVGVGAGQFSLGQSLSLGKIGTRGVYARHLVDVSYRLGFRWSRDPARWAVGVPLWCPALLMTGLVVPAWLADGRASTRASRE